jgi:hypothetical protein
VEVARLRPADKAVKKTRINISKQELADIKTPFAYADTFCFLFLGGMKRMLRGYEKY